MSELWDLFPYIFGLLLLLKGAIMLFVDHDKFYAPVTLAVVIFIFEAVK